MAYTKTEYLNHKLVTYIDPDTQQIIKQDEYIEKKLKHSLANTKGMSMSKRNDYIEIQESIVRSLLDLKIFNFLVKHYSRSGIVMANNKAVTITYLSKHFGVTRQKISTFIRRARKANFVKKEGTSLLLNPFIIVPYNVSNKDLAELQARWKALEEEETNKLT